MFPGTRIAAVAAAAILSLGGCSGTTPTATPNGSVGPAPTTTGPSGSAFSLTVLPERFVGKSIGDQRVILLVTASGTASDGPVAIRATAGGERVEVEPAELEPGKVGEVTVVPAAITGEHDLIVTITATRDDVVQTEERTIPLVEGTDSEAATARGNLARFTGWLGESRPELGISDGTEWQGTPGSWVLVVTHYIFVSDAWELDMAWHVMMPPDDWIRINLRHRWTETTPSIAFEIPSAAGIGGPREIAPDDAVWR